MVESLCLQRRYVVGIDYSLRELKICLQLLVIFESRISWNSRVGLEYASSCMDAENYPRLEDNCECAGCLRGLIRMLSI